MNQHSILVCEDEASLREDLALELAEAGYRVFQAGDGEQALALLERERPDLVLCDICMPRVDGLELVALLRNERPDLADVPILFLTALGQNTQIVAGKQAGADDYLVKPIDYEVMLATVAAHLRQVARLRAGVEAELGRAREVLEAAALADEAALDRLSQGIVLIDRAGGVMRANRAARALCNAQTGLTIDTHIHCEGTPALRGAVEASLRGEVCDTAPISLPRRDGARDLIALVGPVAAKAEGQVAVLVLIVDPARRLVPDSALLARAFRLTRTEARIASLLAQGQRPDEIAEELGVTGTTVSFHLKNLFSKTATNRQSDLVALILSLSPLLPL